MDVQVALDYAAQGYRVLALGKNSKVPVKDKEFQPNGSLSATTDPEKIQQLWKLYPESNIGIATGKESGITVVDFDDDHEKIIAELGFKPPRTKVVKTPRGMHIYLPYDPEFKQSAGLIEHIDVRNDGGYVVAPPSQVDGNNYRWIAPNAPLQAWPQIKEVLDQARTVSHSKHSTTFSVATSPNWVTEALLNGATDGSRNDTATRLAGYFRSIDLARDIAMATMKQFADNCTPPMDYHEMTQALTSVWNYLPTNTYKGTVLEAPIVDVAIANKRVFRWPTTDVLMSCDRITDQGSRLETVVSFGTSSAPHLYGPIRINLLSDSARASTIRNLKDRADRNWLAVIDDAAKIILDSLDPAGQLIDIATYKPEKLTGWSVAPFVREGLANMLYGDGGAGKSTLAVAIALTKATGVPILPGLRCEEAGAVLLADWETTPDEFYYTAQALLKGAGIAGKTRYPILYRHYAGPITDHLHSLQRDTHDHEVKLMVVDSIVPASGVDVTDAEAPRIYFSAINELGVASLGITHVAKDGELPYGSVYWNNLSRNNWQVVKEDAAGDNVVAAYHRKGNRTGGVHKPMAWLTTWESDINDNPEKIKYDIVDIHGFATLDEGTSPGDRIMAYLKENPSKFPNEVAEDLGINRNTVRTNLRRGAEKKMYKVDPTGRYSVHSILDAKVVETLEPEPEPEQAKLEPEEDTIDLPF